MPTVLFVGAASLLALAVLLLFSKAQPPRASNAAAVIPVSSEANTAHRNSSFQPASFTSTKGKTAPRITEEQREQVRKLLDGVTADLKSREASRYQHLRSLENDLADTHLGVISPATSAERIEFTGKSDEVLSVLEEPARNFATLALQALQEDYLFPEDKAKVLMLRVPADHTQPVTLVTTMTPVAAAEDYQAKVQESTNTDVLPLIEGANKTSQLPKLDAQWRYSLIFPAAGE